MDPRHSTWIAFASIGVLAVLGWRGADVASAVAAVAIGIAGAHGAADAMRSYSNGGDDATHQK